MYHIEVTGFSKLIQKLKKHPLKKDIIADIDELQINPKKGKFISSKNLYELRYPNLRIYYIITEGMIVINDDEFEGILTIKDKGNKNHQKRYLK